MSIMQKKSGRLDHAVKGNAVVVAVKACKEIPSAALKWALTNVVCPGDCVRLLVLIPSHSSSFWGLPHFHNDCASGNWRFMSGTIVEQREYITDLCSQMLRQLHGVYDPEKVTVKMKVVCESSHGGVVASEAKKAQTHWVVLDKRMKKEAHLCAEQLDCSVIVVKHSEPKVLQLNLIEPRKVEETKAPPCPKPSTKCHKDHSLDIPDIIKVSNVTPTTSPEKTSSISSSLDMFTSATFISNTNWEPKVMKKISRLPSQNVDFYHESDSDSESQILSSRSTSMCSQSSTDEGPKLSKSKSGTFRFSEIYMSPESCKNVREVISFKKNAPLDSPPLCSICHHKTPSFGKPPRMFSYSELEQATSGFSEANFLAEGGHGSVHRGVLSDGQVVAVRQHKLASTQGDREFCSEVQILSCAQHRNVVMLIGYCVEDGRRLLVYEYICNGSLDLHLYGRNVKLLDWAVRQKIAVGAARGLRYLHEECRIGCIIHRDMRPNNILLTHDFEPLVGDFGLARMQVDGDSFEKTRIIGTFGYMAPEYAQTGQLCEKADVYSFGVVLVELVTGRKAVDKSRPKSEQYLTEWARRLLDANALYEHVDPCLMNCYSEKEVQTMLHCSSLCLQKDPKSRPRMSQVLRMLEGDILMI
ncbi:hypothetical protein OROHE_006159 [Orobanche hederae]